MKKGEGESESEREREREREKGKETKGWDEREGEREREREGGRGRDRESENDSHCRSFRFPKATGRSFFSCKFYCAAEGGLIFFARAVPAAILCGWKGRPGAPEFTLITFPGYYGLCKNVIDNNGLSSLNYTSLPYYLTKWPAIVSELSWNQLLFLISLDIRWTEDLRQSATSNEVISLEFKSSQTRIFIFGLFVIFAWHFLSRYVKNLLKHFSQSDSCSILSDLNMY